MTTVTRTDAICMLLTNLADRKVEVQVRLRDFSVQPMPLGPGVLEQHDTVTGIFRIVTAVHMQVPGSTAPPQRAQAPFLFHADDVIWVSEPPVREEAPRIEVPGAPRGGGIIIGGS